MSKDITLVTLRLSYRFKYFVFVHCQEVNNVENKTSSIPLTLCTKYCMTLHRVQGILCVDAAVIWDDEKWDINKNSFLQS